MLEEVAPPIMKRGMPTGRLADTYEIGEPPLIDGKVKVFGLRLGAIPCQSQNLYTSAVR